MTSMKILSILKPRAAWLLADFRKKRLYHVAEQITFYRDLIRQQEYEYFQAAYSLRGRPPEALRNVTKTYVGTIEYLEMRIRIYEDLAEEIK